MNTRISHRILSAALAGALCLTAHAAAMASEFATVKGGGLNLRQKASLEAKVLGQYGTGTWIEVVKKGETWSQVKVNCKEGYMMTKYLSFGAAGSTLYVRTNTGIGLNLLGKMLQGLLKLVMLGWADRLLGLVFALATGVLLVGLGVMLLDTLNVRFGFISEETLESSVLYSPLKDIANTVFPYIKEWLFKK